MKQGVQMTRLHKSKTNRVLFGVCGGLSDSLGLDAPFIRLGFIFGAIFTGSLLFWIYLILALVLPTRD
jgi:phage shock protein PspC (stress-responsive transcriptional regulator)